jgi:hypothetical protein
MRLWPFGHKAKPAADLAVGQPAILAVLPWRPASSGDNANSSVAQLTANMTAYVNLVESLRGRKVRVIGSRNLWAKWYASQISLPLGVSPEHDDALLHVRRLGPHKLKSLVEKPAAEVYVLVVHEPVLAELYRAVELGQGQEVPVPNAPIHYFAFYPDNIYITSLDQLPEPDQKQPQPDQGTI